MPKWLFLTWYIGLVAMGELNEETLVTYRGHIMKAPTAPKDAAKFNYTLWKSVQDKKERDYNERVHRKGTLHLNFRLDEKHYVVAACNCTNSIVKSVG